MATIAHWKRRVKLGLFTDPMISKVLGDGQIERRCREAGHQWRRSFWSPGMTMLTFLLQVLHETKTLRAAVACLLTHVAAHDEVPLPTAESPWNSSRTRVWPTRNFPWACST